MRLVSLYWSNLHDRGTDPSIDIPPALCITGPNDAGKTTLLSLPEIILAGPTQGTWPALGRPDYTFHAAGKWVEGDDAIVVMRGLSDEGKHHVSLDGRPRKIREAEQHLAPWVGSAWALSIEEILGMSGRARVAWLEDNRILDAGLDAAEVLAHLVDGLDLDLDLTTVDLKGREGGRALLNAVVTHLEQADRANEAEIRSLRGTLDRLAKREIGTVTGTAGEARAKIDELDAEIAELEGRAGEIRGSATARQALTSTTKRIEETMAGLTSDDDFVTHLATLERKLADLEKTIEDRKATIADLMTEINASQARLSELDAEAEPLEERSTELRLVAQEAKAAREATSRIESFMAAARAVVDHDEAHPVEDDENLGELIEALRHELEDLDEVLDVDLGQVEEEYQGLQTKLAAVKRAQDTATAKYGTQQGHLKQRRAKLETLRAEHGKVTYDLEEARAQRRALAVRREALRTELEAAREEAADLGDEDSAAVLETLAALRERRKELVQLADKLSDQAALDAQEEEVRTQLGDALANRRAIRGDLEQVRTYRRQVLADVANQNLRAASDLTKAVLGRELNLDLEADAAFDLEGIPVDTASHSQRTVAMIALYVALAQRQRGWKVVLLDDLEHLGRERRTALAEYLRGLVEADLLDQFILAGVADGWQPPEGVTHLRLTT